jgi:hypothetical protein
VLLYEEKCDRRKVGKRYQRPAIRKQRRRKG